LLDRKPKRIATPEEDADLAAEVAKAEAEAEALVERATERWS
jgi:hypothetical protein